MKADIEAAMDHRLSFSFTDTRRLVFQRRLPDRTAGEGTEYSAFAAYLEMTDDWLVPNGDVHAHIGMIEKLAGPAKRWPADPWFQSAADELKARNIPRAAFLRMARQEIERRDAEAREMARYSQVFRRLWSEGEIAPTYKQDGVRTPFPAHFAEDPFECRFSDGVADDIVIQAAPAWIDRDGRRRVYALGVHRIYPSPRLSRADLLKLDSRFHGYSLEAVPDIAATPSAKPKLRKNPHDGEVVKRLNELRAALKVKNWTDTATWPHGSFDQMAQRLAPDLQGWNWETVSRVLRGKHGPSLRAVRDGHRPLWRTDGTDETDASGKNASVRTSS